MGKHDVIHTPEIHNISQHRQNRTELDAVGAANLVVWMRSDRPADVVVATFH